VSISTTAKPLEALGLELFMLEPYIGVVYLDSVNY
jgi:hypothetical protein